MKVLSVTSCRACGRSDLHPVLDLGSLHINAFIRPDDPLPEKAPLHLAVCASCHFLQLLHTVSPDALYRTFWYRSGITQTMKRALWNVCNDVLQKVALNRGDTVVDIGSNDSTLLRYWAPDLERIGFEPATNLMEDARSGGMTVVNDYFSLQGLKEVTSKRAKVITAIAMFYDIHSPGAFLADVRQALTRDGVFVVQMSYLPRMLETNDIGNICHEHLGYYSLTSLSRLFTEHGLTIVDVDFNEINGGSFRVYAMKGDPEVKDSVKSTLRVEKALGLHALKTYQDFAKRASEIRTHVQGMVKHAPSPVHVYGASTKGNTLLQYWGLGPNELPAAAERDRLKWGLQTVTRIPIIPEERSRKTAKSFLVLPWFFREEILLREAKSPQLWIWPLPYPEATTSGGLLTTIPHP